MLRGAERRRACRRSGAPPHGAPRWTARVRVRSPAAQPPAGGGREIITGRELGGPQAGQTIRFGAAPAGKRRKMLAASFSRLRNHRKGTTGGGVGGEWLQGKWP